ncbi:MAG: putative porin [Methylococcaceae bacterium]|nr:putative porin [Methylococcaceae bacterium]
MATTLLVGSWSSVVCADEPEKFLKVKKSTFVNLVDLLVNRGVLDKKDAKNLVTEAEDEAAAEAKQPPPKESLEAATAKPGSTEAQSGKAKKGSSKYVAYVPEFLKEEIRNQVRSELKDDILKDVKTHASKERWGIPDALPDWVSRIKPYFDLRLRGADDMFDSRNAQYYDWLTINKDGGLSQAQAKNEAFQNTRIDRFRLRERFRIGFDAQLTEGLTAGVRFATSNQFNPVSNNQTLGNTGQSWTFALDRAYLQYDFVDSTGNDWFSLYGGRIPNPFVSTDVVYDPDLSFEGFAGTFRLNLGRDDPKVKSYHLPNAIGRAGVNLGPQHPNSVFATMGIFPIQEVNFTSSDKWLMGGQLGADWLVGDESRLKFATSYYDYQNITARRNSYESLQFDWTAPQFMQKGNSLVAINDSKNQPGCSSGVLGSQNVCLVGLASEFKIVNATLMYDYSHFAPIHAMLTLDYAKNIGFNRKKILQQFGDNIAPRTDAYQARLDLGRTELKHFKDWNLFFAYRYVERDAVLDAFTDSVFHLGGTDAKGWVVGAQYGLANNTWLNLRWFNTDWIDGPADGATFVSTSSRRHLIIDTLTVDLNAKF